MSAYETAPEPSGAHAVAPFQALVHSILDSVLSGTLHLALGVALGRLGARLMHNRHLHWSWAVAGLGLTVLARPLLGGMFLSAASATVVAAAVGRRRHREDITAGADLAELAAARRTPIDGVRALVGALAARLGWHGMPGTQGIVGEEEIVIGLRHNGRPVVIPIGGATGGVHTLTPGAAGSGKTVTLRRIAVQAILRGRGSIVVDPKGDSELREELRHAAQAVGKRFIHWTPTGPSVYNPYARGSDTEIADRALAGERFTEPHYLRQAQRYLGHAVRALRMAGEEVGLSSLVQHMDPEALEQLARRMPAEAANATHGYLDSLTPRQRGELGGVRDRLAIMAESDVGPWLQPRPDGAPAFDLFGALTEGAVVLFDLQADSRPLLAKMLGAAIVQDLQSAISTMHRCPVPSVVVIDEFAAIAAEQVAGVFARARSAGVSLVLGTQELSDLRLPGRESLHDAVFGNLTTVIGHRQVVPESAELLSSLAGTVGVWRTSIHSDGRHTRSRARQRVVEAERIQSLRPGEAVVTVLDGPRRGTQIATILRSPRDRGTR
ncbi:MAG: type IV secretion system DNA-binding domain-containing protein [Solirubrobacterales bacterium]|nr:type IV secretion system DNA-binding domain-containing protein [Solirubrobacterales bacterium]